MWWCASQVFSIQYNIYMKKTLKETSSKLSGNYVLYGFMKSHPTETGYLGMIPRSLDDEVIVDDISAAMLFDAG